MANPVLSIGIIFRDDIRSIERCLKALQPLRDTLPCELVLADTGSEDGSRAVAETLIQAKQFMESAGLTGVVLTKLDGTAKGGIVVAIARELGIPVKFIGVGEGVDDLMPFEPEAFVEALL